MGLVISEVKDELLIYDLRINQAFCLNQTSALVWPFSNGENSISEIGQLMNKNLKMRVPEEFVCCSGTVSVEGAVFCLCE